MSIILYFNHVMLIRIEVYLKSCTYQVNEVSACSLTMGMRFTVAAHSAGIASLIEYGKATTRLSIVSRSLIIASSISISADTTKPTTYGKLPMPPPLPVSTGLTITNPLVLYRALLSTKTIDPDPAQHRLALKLQELYHRLKDYSPQTEYGARLKAVSRAVQYTPDQDKERPVAVPGHPWRRNPLFAHLFRNKEQQDTLALMRVLTRHDAAMNLDSPRGLLLYGEVGTGKSMLLDLLADSLPSEC